MADVVLEGVTKRYGVGKPPAADSIRAAAATGFGVEGLNLRVADREFLVLVGPSGCGKSTTLRLIAGLEKLTAGRILIGGRVVDNLPPAERDIAMVFQNYALYPHMTVEGNLAFGLRLRYGGGISARVVRRLVNPRRAAELAVQRRGIEQRVRQAAERLGISHLLDRKPHELSGGERQRVALGRAIVRDPAAFLFDEPLSNLDAKLRQQMRSELKQLHESLGATTIYVTHDQVEAMTLGQRVAVMDRGRLQQIGTPEEIYDEPANLFVARFFGSTPINLLPGELVGSGTEVEFVSGQCRWRLGPERSSRCRHWPRQVTLAVRGEDLHPYRGSLGEAEGGSGLGHRDLGWDQSGGQFGASASFPGGQRGQPEAEHWRLPPLTVRQIDNWGDAQVVECELDGRLSGATNSIGKKSPGDLSQSGGGRSGGGRSGGGGDGSRASDSVVTNKVARSTSVEETSAGSLVAKLAGSVPGRLRRGEALPLEFPVGRAHWFDSATGHRLGWSY